jgi:hypothetical protein
MLSRQLLRSPKALIVIALVLGVPLALAVWTIAWETHVRSLVCSVSSVTDSPKDFNKWGEPTAFDRQVRTRNCGVLNMNSDWLRPPTARVAAVHRDSSYVFTVVGWRSAVFDMMPNIVATRPST